MSVHGAVCLPWTGRRMAWSHWWKDLPKSRTVRLSGMHSRHCWWCTAGRLSYVCLSLVHSTFSYASTGPYISVPPSFLFSGATPLLYVLAQAAVEALPASSIPMPTFTTELPLALLDGFTRAILLCTLIPPAIQSSPIPELAESPWALLLGSFVSPPLYIHVPTTALKTNDRSSPTAGSSSPTFSLFISQPRSRSPRPRNCFPMAG